MMGLVDAGKLRISKSGKALEFVDEHHVIGNFFFYASLAQVKELLEGKRAWVQVSMLVSDNRENVGG